MIKEEPLSINSTFSVIGKLKMYLQMMKPVLNFTVALTSVLGFLLVPNIQSDWLSILVLFLGGVLVTNGASVINQILEKDSDNFMHRTEKRPLPEGRISVTEAWIVSFVTATVGTLLIGLYFNWWAALISVFSLILYGFIYTPMKKIHPVATFIGSVPGALPPLIGWVAGCTQFNSGILLGGVLLFAIQFFWQIPHVWAIAWLHYDDYLKAGIRLLPNKKIDTHSHRTGLEAFLYSLTLFIFIYLLYHFNLIGFAALWMGLILSVLYALSNILFFIQNNKRSAKRVFFTSLFYLPLLLLIFVLDKV